MQNEISTAIVTRFFDAVRTLIEMKHIRGVKTFTDKYNINRWNFLSLEKEPHRNMFELEWMYYLCRDYNVSPYWLLSGEGEMFTDGIIQKVVNTMKEQTSMGTVKIV